MSFSKKLLAVAAVGALTVVTTAPAMALENEFHGLFRVRGFVSNFDDGSAGAVTPTFQPGTKNFIEQRARLLYQAKANDDLKLVTHFEIDSRWGDASYSQTANTANSSFRNAGGGIGADQVNIETKNVYVDFNCPVTKANYKVGIQGFNDNYKGIIFNNDAAGVVVNKKYGKAAAQLAYFRFDDATTGTASVASEGIGGTTPVAITNATVGNRTRDFLTLGGKYNVTDAVKVGADYYLLYGDVLRDTQDRTDIQMVGVNAEAKVGPATVDGFLLYQFGKVGGAATVNGKAAKAQTVNAFAANVGGKVKAGPGTARVNALYISGDNNPGVGDRNDFQTILERSSTSAGHAFYAGEMLLLLRSKYATAGTDRALVFDLNNQNQGLIGGFLGYDLNIDKFFVYTNVGFAARHAVAVPGSTTNNTNYLGTEINTEIGYKLFDNLSASVQAAYLALGDYFKGTAKKNATTSTDPENPYSTRIQLTYTF